MLWTSGEYMKGPPAGNKTMKGPPAGTEASPASRIEFALTVVLYETEVVPGTSQIPSFRLCRMRIRFRLQILALSDFS